MKVLLLTPPMTQLNTPYPATAYLTGFLRKIGVNAVQADPAIELFLKLFSREGLKNIRDQITSTKIRPSDRTPSVAFFLDRSEDYLNTIDSAIRFLQGKDPTLAFRIVGRNLLPEGPRFQALGEGGSEVGGDSQAWAFGSLGIQDRAKFLASLMVDDLADVIREGVDPHFYLSRYGEKLAASQRSFDSLNQALNQKGTWVDLAIQSILEAHLNRENPDVLGLSVPFPGNVYGAFRLAQFTKLWCQRNGRSPIPIILGGGYVNTELRSLSDPRVFDYVDYITYDDGEMPMLCLLEHLQGKRSRDQLFRTRVREDGQVVWKSSLGVHDIPHRDTGTPTYDGLPLADYVSLFEFLNPMHRLWSDGRWNKLTLAHGCYWKKCNFCDVTLDYIGRYDPASARLIVDRMESLVRETGQSGFHFVDEAAPPAVLKGVAEEILSRGLTVTWWGNIRFDKVFTPELAELLARSGCVAVSGGLEVASDRLLKLMNKGVTVEQVARVTQGLTNAGIMVHAYLMYGFPTQTVQETVDALERVRQLFEEGCIQSGFWHRFAATAHSPIGKDPEAFKIRILNPVDESEPVFAVNDLEFVDPTKCDHEFLGAGLNRALYNYMQGVGFDLDIREWFGRERKKYFVPAPQVPANLIQRALRSASSRT